MRKLRETSKVKMGEESVKTMKSRTQKWVHMCTYAYIYVQGKGWLKNQA